MLRDKDRIFTNIFGLDDPFLASAKKRGDWNGTKKILNQGREKIIEDIKNSLIDFWDNKKDWEAKARLAQNKIEKYFTAEIMGNHYMSHLSSKFN